jgi:hypothetical protein
MMCSPELKVTVGPETYIVRASPSYRQGKPWRDYVVIEIGNPPAQVLARVWALFECQRVGGACALIHVYTKAPNADVLLPASHLAWPVMEATSWRWGALENALVDTAYVLPVPDSKEENEKDRMGDPRYVLWVDKDLYANMHPLPQAGRVRARRDRRA